LLGDYPMSAGDDEFGEPLKERSSRPGRRPTSVVAARATPRTVRDAVWVNRESDAGSVTLPLRPAGVGHKTCAAHTLRES
jgi:hypothetical protein